MKKLMVVAAIAFAATFANAAAVGWSCAGLNNYANDAYGFFIIGQNGVTSVAQITALIEGGSDYSSYVFGSGNVSGTGLANVATTDSGKTVTGAGTYEGFYVLFNDADASKADKYIAITKDQSANLQRTITESAATIQFAAGGQADYVNNADNWQSIPEPTSGLLMLIGFAGLALRRRRA